MVYNHPIGCTQQLIVGALSLATDAHEFFMCS